MSGMATHPVDTLLARAHGHLSGARLSQAVGAFRAAIGVAGTSPKVVPAHLGLADALYAQGRRDEAIAGLVRAAEGLSASEAFDAALVLLGKAIAMDPSRMELHVDAAMAEEAMGRHDLAVARLEGLAERSMDGGRYEEAGELLRMLAAWDVEAPAVDDGPRHTALITGQTVIAMNPLLFPMPVAPAPAAVAPAVAAVAPAVAAVAPSRPAAIVRDDEVTHARVPLVVVAAAASESELESRITLVQAKARPEPVAVPRTAPRPRTTTATARDAALVERLRSRAGLRGAASPRPVAVRRTEPITVRRSNSDRWRVQDEDVTRYFRRPEGLDAAS
jgi:hypothetical protein